MGINIIVELGRAGPNGFILLKPEPGRVLFLKPVSAPDRKGLPNYAWFGLKTHWVGHFCHPLGKATPFLLFVVTLEVGNCF